MPTYEYICRACGHEFEEFQSIKADPIAVCPECRKKKVERKISTGGAVIF
jgi:putative FmdB family regulatory protein